MDFKFVFIFLMFVFVVCNIGVECVDVSGLV